MNLYKTVSKAAYAEQSIQKSRFIAYVSPAESKEEAEAFIEEIRKKHRDATHNVPAMVIGDHFQLQWGSDDGEPQGTSGAPIVQMLVKKELTNLVVVVTRYFGGIKLGPGGLVRAYTSSAQLGLEAAGICQVKLMHVMKYKVDYSLFSKLEKYDFKNGACIRNIKYSDVVEFELICDIEDKERCEKLITGLSNGMLTAYSEFNEECKILI